MHPPAAPSSFSSATTSDMGIYVSVTGSDTAGNGSITSPYATPAKAYSTVPYTINHAVHVHIGAGSYGTDAWPYKIKNTYGDSGVLSFDASSAMTEVESSLTIDVGGFNYDMLYVSSEITVVGGGLVPNAYAGMFIQYTSGVGIGLLAPIIGNTATEISIGPFDVTPNDGDTFRIISPGAEIELDNGLYHLTGDGGIPSFYYIFGSPKVFFFGLRFFSSGFAIFNAVDLCSFSSVGSVFDIFVNIVDSEVVTAAFGYVDISRVLDEVTWESVWDGGCIFNAEIQCLGDCHVYCLTTMGADLRCSGELHYSNISSSVLYAMRVIGTGLSMRHLFVNADAGHPAIGIASPSSGLLIDDLFVKKCDSAIEIRPGCNGISIENLEGVDADVAHALTVGQGCNIAVDAGSCILVGAGGAANAIVWSSGAANSAYPAANAVVSDALGAQVVGY